MTDTVPLVDAHVHLLASLDDGPRDLEEAVQMCRLLVAQGVRHATALAHQNDSYPDNHADRLRAAAAELAARLRQESVPLAVYPTGEVLLTPDIFNDWNRGKLLSVGDHRRFLLVEMPHGEFVDVLPLARSFRTLGVRLVIAHAERYPELLQDRELVEKWVVEGCLIQVTAERIASPKSRAEERVLRSWAERGLMHLLGSDGHRVEGREPRIEGGYRRLADWTDQATADRVGSLWGAAILQGLPVGTVVAPRRQSRSWLARLFS